MDRAAESLPIYRHGVALQKAVLGDCFVSIDSQILYAMALSHAGEKAEMLRVISDALASKSGLGEPADEQTAYLSFMLGVWYVNTGERDRGVQHMLRGAAICKRVTCQKALVGDLQRLRGQFPELAQ